MGRRIDFMTSRTSLKPVARKQAEKLTPEQERFRFLLAQIEKIRKSRASLEKALQDFRRKHTEQLGPLRATLRASLRETVFVIDRALEQQRWSKIDRSGLQEILRFTARTLLDGGQGDSELQAVFDRHSDVTFDEDKRAELEHLKAEAESTLGIDLGDEEILTEEDLSQRLYEHMRNEREREEAGASKRKSADQRRMESSAQTARQSLREVYRKLASAIHPDREPDAKRQAEKNELMQTINRAYATNDLLTLLEIQMRLERVDPLHIAKLSGKRLAQYNRLLAEQLTGERKAIAEMETGFRMDYMLEQDERVEPKYLDRIIKQIGRGIRQEIERQKQLLTVLRTTTATKRWLKERRRFATELDDDDDL
jgi:hypothetical protein